MERRIFCGKFNEKSVTVGNNRVRILIGLKWTNSGISVKIVNSRFLNIRVLIGSVVVNISCVYAPQPGLVDTGKR